MNWQAVLWRGLADEARIAARRLGDTGLKVQTVTIAARYLARAVRAERAEGNKRSDKAE